MSALEITVNGQAHRLDVGATVADLVEGLGAGPRGVAVAVNADVVPRSTWGERTLRDGDQVELLTAAQGG